MITSEDDNIIMKKTPLFLIFFLFFNLSQISLAKNAGAAASLDKIVAVVNNEIVTNSELAQEEEGFKKQLDSSSDLAKLKPEELRQKILKQLIDEKLQLQFAKQREISVSDKAVNAAVEDIAKRNQLSLSKFKDAVKSHGISYVSFRERIRKQMILVRLQQVALGDSAQVSEQEVEDFLKNKQALGVVLRDYHLKQLSKTQAHTFLYQRKLKTQADLWLDKLRDSAYIKIMSN
jgi:parvulin-like peptidyl-prolyl isomerase